MTCISRQKNPRLMISSLVAVHGLGAMPDLSWTESKSKVNWLRDLLPEDLPRTRIMQFGYNSIYFGKDPVRTSLVNIANKLLQALRSKRRVCERLEKSCRAG